MFEKTERVLGPPPADSTAAWWTQTGRSRSTKSVCTDPAWRSIKIARDRVNNADGSAASSGQRLTSDEPESPTGCFHFGATVVVDRLCAATTRFGVVGESRHYGNVVI